jgi:hypothetical protein
MVKGAPKIINTDQDPVFTSNEIKKLFEDLQIQHSVTNAKYKKQQNQVSENFNFRKRKERVLECWKTDEIGLEYWAQLTFQQRYEFIARTIDAFNVTIAAVYGFNTSATYCLCSKIKV